ncbi:MAG: cupin [Rhodospirillales bacterium]|jgi:anti-sigma factor ChrR (cupin superfamily)|nr:cupin [Rhodospirillales bacterium]MBT4040466.1 cupin [Rhodospirillales bacterium]MBT4627039.1 cupin [Rhodospirillales bacterium]MBT5350764.1 cupin [Rhodospirillales bacterium]MBT5521395.1 cupin [Rhodospirillales bacterium]
MVANLNMDFAERVVIDTNTLDWVPSRLPGVERRMLEREHEESGRASSIVRYAPDSQFTAHVHEGGEEFLVLDGVFSDEHGDFGPGSYIRNPIGSKHRPYSKDGCTIFVKLWQMESGDQTWVRADTHTADWHPGLVPGLEVMPLHSYDSENVALVRWQAGCEFTPHMHPQGEEILVLDGTFEDEDGQYPTGTWLRNPPGSRHTPFSAGGCTILVKTGHL